VALVLLSAYLLQNSYAVTQVKGDWLNQWHGERYDGTSTRTEPLQSNNNNNNNNDRLTAFDPGQPG